MERPYCYKLNKGIRSGELSIDLHVFSVGVPEPLLLDHLRLRCKAVTSNGLLLHAGHLTSHGHLPRCHHLLLLHHVLHLLVLHHIASGHGLLLLLVLCELRLLPLHLNLGLTTVHVHFSE